MSEHGEIVGKEAVSDFRISLPSSDFVFGETLPDGYHWHRITCRVNGEKYTTIAMINDELINEHEWLEQFYSQCAIDQYNKDHVQ
jgi:hypothetical protein